MAAKLQGRRLAGLLLATSITALIAVSPASAREPPKTEQELVDRVRAAIAERDLDSMSELINWEGAATIKRRIVNFQVRYGLGRPVRSIALEPFPEGGLREIEARGTLKANMPVSHRLRVVFDESGENGIAPASIFLIGKIGDEFRIALVVQVKRPHDD
jgi:hypothetical protein